MRAAWLGASKVFHIFLKVQSVSESVGDFKHHFGFHELGAQLEKKYRRLGSLGRIWSWKGVKKVSFWARNEFYPFSI